MSSRADILHAVARHRREGVPLPPEAAFPVPSGDPVEAFTRQVEAAGGAVVAAGGSSLRDGIIGRFPEATRITSALENASIGSTDWQRAEDPHVLAGIEVLVCAGTLGVAENGAVWITEAQMVHRVAPFIAQHMVIVLPPDRLVWNMHQAYQQVQQAPFGLFVAGPSKTADIEQALVIGAHGPRSLTVFLTQP